MHAALSYFSVCGCNHGDVVIHEHWQWHRLSVTLYMIVCRIPEITLRQPLNLLQCQAGVTFIRFPLFLPCTP